MKVCKTHGLEYALRCRLCHNESNKQSRERNKGKAITPHRAAWLQMWRDNHKKHISIYNKTYRNEHKEKEKTYMAEYGKKNRKILNRKRRENPNTPLINARWNKKYGKEYYAARLNTVEYVRELTRRSAIWQRLIELPQEWLEARLAQLKVKRIIKGQTP